VSQNMYILDNSYHSTGLRENKSQDESALHKKNLEPKHILSGQVSNDGNQEEVPGCCVLPTILYSAQKWSLAGKYNKMMQVCQHKLERKIDFFRSDHEEQGSKHLS
jgi:hypothetical protein